MSALVVYRPMLSRTALEATSGGTPLASSTAEQLQDNRDNCCSSNKQSSLINLNIYILTIFHSKITMDILVNNIALVEKQI